jgi:hypothetical protein
MKSIRGYFQNNTFFSTGNDIIPEGSQVIVTILDDVSLQNNPDSNQQRKIFADFFATIHADPEKLPSSFDEVISEGMKFKEYDWS